MSRKQLYCDENIFIKKNNFEQRIKWGEKQQKYNTVETVPKSNRKTVEIGKNNTPTT